MTKGNQTGGCPIRVTEYLTVRETIMITIQNNIQITRTKSHSQLIVNFINSKICVPKKIINLVEYIKMLSYLFRDIRIEYYNILINGNANSMAKTTYY